MKVRFVLPIYQSRDLLFDRTVSLPAVPLPGETVVISLGETPTIVKVDSRRWYVDEEEPLIEIYLRRFVSHDAREALDDVTVRDERERRR